ncbi:hypothetical protein G7046_g3261 [Stylonectria norvegica]|nr:hypothetical protein G7046_g3261 [Stylonectria norvegica]
MGRLLLEEKYEVDVARDTSSSPPANPPRHATRFGFRSSSNNFVTWLEMGFYKFPSLTRWRLRPDSRWLPHRTHPIAVAQARQLSPFDNLLLLLDAGGTLQKSTISNLPRPEKQTSSRPLPPIAADLLQGGGTEARRRDHIAVAALDNVIVDTAYEVTKSRRTPTLDGRSGIATVSRPGRFGAAFTSWGREERVAFLAQTESSPHSRAFGCTQVLRPGKF